MSAAAPEGRDPAHLNRSIGWLDRHGGPVEENSAPLVAGRRPTTP